MASNFEEQSNLGTASDVLKCYPGRLQIVADYMARKTSEYSRHQSDTTRTQLERSLLAMSKYIAVLQSRSEGESQHNPYLDPLLHALTDYRSHVMHMVAEVHDVPEWKKPLFAHKAPDQSLDDLRYHHFKVTEINELYRHHIPQHLRSVGMTELPKEFSVPHQSEALLILMQRRQL